MTENSLTKVTSTKQTDYQPQSTVYMQESKGQGWIDVSRSKYQLPNHLLMLS